MRTRGLKKKREPKRKSQPAKKKRHVSHSGLRTELVSPLSASASWWSVAVVVRRCRRGCPVAVVVAGGRRHLSASSIAKKRQRPQVVGGAWLRRALCCAGSVLCRFGAVLLLSSLPQLHLNSTSARLSFTSALPQHYPGPSILPHAQLYLSSRATSSKPS
jgi:hypothetical protein